MTHHVADLNEIEALLPSYMRQNMARVYEETAHEVVYMVNEETGEIDGGSIVDTVNDLYCHFALMVDPLDPMKMDGVTTTEWLPLPSDDDEDTDESV